MEIHELAKSYLELKGRLEEKRRVIDYEHSKTLKALKASAIDINGKLRVITFENEIRNEEELFNQYEKEIKEIAPDLKEELKKVNATRNDALKTHLEGSVYISTYLDENGEIVSNSYHKIN